MKKYSNIRIAIMLIIVMVIASFLSRKMEDLREAELFYRWTVSSAEQMRFENKLEQEFSDADAPEMMDDEIFAAIEQLGETVLPDIPLKDVDTPDSGKQFSKLIRLVYDGNYDKQVWNMLKSSALKETHASYLEFHKAGRVSSMTGSINAASGYASGANVSLANIFLGFSKVAANFIWLKVDTYYHQGMTHRMMPLMKTCVMLDPNFVEAYLLGSWHIAYNETAHLPATPWKLMEWNSKYEAFLGEKELLYYRGADFLKEGIQKNPRDYRLYFDIGYAIYEQKLNDHKNAVNYLEGALHHRHDKWVPRMLFRSLMLNGDHEKAIAGWQDYLTQDVGEQSEYTARKFIKINRGLLAEKLANEAATAGDTTKEEDYKKQAQAIWRDLFESEMDPPLAAARLNIMNAKDYAKEGRYHEAVALLLRARTEHTALWDEISDLIIELKQDGNLPLGHSEQMQVIRVREAEKYMKQKMAEIGKS